MPESQSLGERPRFAHRAQGVGHEEGGLELVVGLFPRQQEILPAHIDALGLQFADYFPYLFRTHSIPPVFFRNERMSRFDATSAQARWTLSRTKGTVAADIRLLLLHSFVPFVPFVVSCLLASLPFSPYSPFFS
jgi:hypothetical protein